MDYYTIMINYFPVVHKLHKTHNHLNCDQFNFFLTIIVCIYFLAYSNDAAEASSNASKAETKSLGSHQNYYAEPLSEPNGVNSQVYDEIFQLSCARKSFRLNSRTEENFFPSTSRLSHKEITGSEKPLDPNLELEHGEMEETGLQMAEKAERIELQGVLIRRLRKLSTSTSHKYPKMSQTSSPQYPHTLVEEQGDSRPTTISNVDDLSPIDKLPHWEVIHCVLLISDTI